MAQVKLMWIIADILGIPIYLMGILQNIDNGRAIILSILGAMYIILRMYHFNVEKNLRKREKEIDLWYKEEAARKEGWKGK